MDFKLKKWTQENKKDLIRICNSVDRSYLSNRLPYPYTDESADWWYANVVSSDGKSGLYRAICVAGETVGSISLELKQDIYCKDAELGYMLESTHSSTGIMTEAVKSICEIAFLELDIVRISAEVFSENRASQRVLEKNGFTLEGIIRQVAYKNGRLYDVYLYGKCKEGLTVSDKPVYATLQNSCEHKCKGV